MKLKTTLVFLLIAQLSFGQNKVQIIDSLLTSIYNTGKLNGNILIAESGQVIYNRSFGLANEITSEKLNENSVFQLASVSKQFTAMAIVILKEQGKLNFDDKITKYLPELSIYGNVSIRNLLNHTSGLPDYMHLIDSLFNKSKIATNKDIIGLFIKYEPKARFDPNTTYEYSNTGYAFLASIIERVSGLTYSKYLDKMIFKPLKMNSTMVYNSRLFPKDINSYAYGYVYSDSLKKYCLPDSLKNTKFVVQLDGIVGDGNVISTVNDLLKWDRALYTDQLISYSDMKEIFQGNTLKDGTKTAYGFGWILEENSEFGKIAYHGGGWPGYSTYIERHIDSDKTIIILQNRTSQIIPLEVDLIRKVIYNKPLTMRIEIKLSNDQMQKLIGTYVFWEGFELKISMDNGHLFGQLNNQDPYPLFAENELSLFVKGVDSQLQFEKNEAGEITQLFVTTNGNKMKAQKKK
jgi:CubicO group peptidase (beta-lactamase class C family)